MIWPDLFTTPYPEEDWIEYEEPAEDDGEDDDYGNPYADASYDVGKGKPPVHTRFQPGQSGNPQRGPNRPPKTFGAALEKAANRQIRVNLNGEQQQMTRMEAAGEVTAQEAAKGKKWAVDKLEKVGVQVETSGAQKQENKALKKRIKELEEELEEAKANKGGLLVLPPAPVCELEFQIRHCDARETFEVIKNDMPKLLEMLLLLQEKRGGGRISIDWYAKAKEASERTFDTSKR